MTGKNTFFPSANAQPTLAEVADLIKSGSVKNIVCLVGAGISTSAGIPDFRSPHTGIYANLAQYNLPYPEAIFDITYFPNNPEAFFALAKEIYPSNFFPTLTHCFFMLLHQKGMLRRCFSQNIDTLERAAGLPAEKIVEAHGSFATASCLLCKNKVTAEELKPKIDQGTVARCEEPSCQGKKRAIIKPDIVFFGEGLPERFWKLCDTDLDNCDLLLVLGTSLQVQPFASLIDSVPDSCPRVLINLESVGEFDDQMISGGAMLGYGFREQGFDFEGKLHGGSEYARDVCWLGHADDGIRELATCCGWQDELQKIYDTARTELSKKWNLPMKNVRSPEAEAENKAENTAEKIQEKLEEKTDLTPKDDESVQKSKDETIETVTDRLGNIKLGTGEGANRKEGKEGQKGVRGAE